MGITIYSEHRGLNQDGDLLGYYFFEPYGQRERCNADGISSHQKEIILQDGPLFETLSDNAKTPIFMNSTPQKQVIGHYRLGRQNERIPCDSSGRTGSPADQARVPALNPDPHFLSNGMWMYSDISAYGQVLGHYRLEKHGNDVQPVLCDAHGRTDRAWDGQPVAPPPPKAEAMLPPPPETEAMPPPPPPPRMAITSSMSRIGVFTNRTPDGQVLGYYRLGPREDGNFYGSIGVPRR